MEWRTSKRWEAVGTTCRELEKRGVLSQRGKLLYALDDALDEMAMEMKLRMQQVLSGMQGRIEDGNGADAFNAILRWGSQEVEKWGALRKSHQARKAATEAVRADEMLRTAFEELKEHADREVARCRRQEAEKAFSSESRVCYNHL